MEIFLKQGIATTIVFPLLTASSATRKSSATLAAGDFKICRHTAGVWNVANPTTATPTEIGTTGLYALPLTATELTPDDQQYPVIIACHDAAGAEWDDQAVVIRVFTNDVDDLSTAANLALVQADTDNIQTRIPAALVSGKMDSSVSAVTAAGLSDFFDVNSGVTYSGAISGSVVKEIALGAGGSGAGAVTHTVNVTDGTNPLDGVEVWVTTDAGGTNIVAAGNTDALGNVVFMLDVGTYYLWKQLAGYSFTNPQTISVT